MVTITVEFPVLVAKRAFWLAWQTVGKTFGTGFLQDHSRASEEDVWNNILTRGDYPGDNAPPPTEPYADYVFGRMMKFGLQIGPHEVIVSDSECELDYQPWCHKYPTYQALIEAAIETLRPKQELAS